MTFSWIAWEGAGCPDGKFKVSDYRGVCATCGGKILDKGVGISDFAGSSFSNHSVDFRNRLSTHVCKACAWLYSAGPSKPGNFIATSEKFYYCAISTGVEGKQSLYNVIKEISTNKCDMPVSGVITTDVKPRLWTKTKAATIGSFGLYVHAPEYNESKFINFKLNEFFEISSLIRDLLNSRFSKKSILTGLQSNYGKFISDLTTNITLEKRLIELRKSQSFLPALIVTGEKNE